MIAPDLPGHGLSDKPDDDSVYTTEHLVAAIGELLGVLHLESVHLVAQSMAGTLAVDLLTLPDARVQRVALVNPVSFGRVRMEWLLRLVSPLAIDAILPRLVRRWMVARTHQAVYGDPSRLTERDVDEYWAPSQFPAYARAMRRLLRVFTWTRADVDVMAGRLRPFAGRLLVILSTRDRLVLDARPYVARLQTLLPRLRVYSAEGGGHAVNEERPEELVPLVRTFLVEAE